MADIVIVDADAAAARRFAETLALDGHVAHVESTTEAATARALKTGAPIVVIGLDSFPSQQWGDILRRLRSKIAAAILAVSSSDAESDVVLALRFGADAYVRQPGRALELLAKVEALLRRSRRTDPDTERIRVRDLLIDRPARAVLRSGQLVPVSPYEFRLLETLALRRGAAVSRRELLAEVWNRVVPSRTVDIHIAQLRKKLEATPSDPSIIETVRSYGYRMRFDDEH